MTRKHTSRGSVLIATAVSAVALVGMVGFSVDLGRLYIAKSEAQAFADSAALAAAAELDGTLAGITDARNAVAANANKWNFNSRPFSTVTIEFAQNAAGPWLPAPDPAAGYRFVRVTPQIDVSLLFLPIVVPNWSQLVRAKAVAAQVPKTFFREALFPFSPFARNNLGPNFGLTPGTLYTLRWASNPTLKPGQGNSNVCEGDRSQAIVDLAQAMGGSERGFIEETSASNIRATVIDDYQTVFRTIGDLVAFTGGAKQTILDALTARINQDTDSQSQTFSQYLNLGRGNGRRIVACPLNDGGNPPGVNHRIVGIGAFFLQRTGEYGNGGNQTWCAEYIGAWVQGSRKKGVGDGLNGAFVVRLVD
jgi:hypothetical protein